MTSELLIYGFLIFVLIMTYLLPTAVAVGRDMHGKGGLFFLNLLLGWTALGWLVCLIWSFVGETQRQYERLS